MMDKIEKTDDWIEAAELLRRLLDEDPGMFLATAKKLGIQTRKAYYLAQIDRALDGLAVPRERLLRIGWTKLQVIAPHITSENAETLLGRAEAHPVHVLRDAVGEHVGETAKHCVILYLFEDEYEIFAEVLVAHGASLVGRGIKWKEEALMTALEKLTSV